MGGRGDQKTDREIKAHSPLAIGGLLQIGNALPTRSERRPLCREDIPDLLPDATETGGTSELPKNREREAIE
jgi:hypothetical protein